MPLLAERLPKRVAANPPRHPAPALEQRVAPRAAGARWGEVMRAVADQATDRVRVQPGDTLWKLVSQRLGAAGLEASAAAVRQGIGLVAEANCLGDPDRIVAGQTLDLSALSRAVPEAAPRAVALASAFAAPEPGPAAAEAVAAAVFTPVPTAAVAAAGPGALLEATLARAVRKGYVPAQDVGRVRERIHRLAAAYRFEPDDLARVALMESDGFDPRASNGRCFGILQFCEGAGRGADSVGMRGRAAEITNRSVWEQLDLVERYLADVGFGSGTAPAALDDLYLAVLMPAARAQTDPQAALGIPGRQARLLHEGADPARPITRASIVAGLALHARQALEAEASARPVAAAGGNTPTAQRQGLAAIAMYGGVALAGQLVPAAPAARW